MQTKITFGNGATSTPSPGTFNHENFHQWFGDNVSEAAYTCLICHELPGNSKSRGSAREDLRGSTVKAASRKV